MSSLGKSGLLKGWVLVMSRERSGHLRREEWRFASLTMLQSNAEMHQSSTEATT